jgi:hypothetical protein
MIYCALVQIKDDHVDVAGMKEKRSEYRIHVEIENSKSTCDT